jgi:integrase
MGTIVARRRKDGTTGYTAQILKKRGGEVVLREAQTFDRKATADSWIKKRETELSVPGAIDRAVSKKVTLAQAIDRYVNESLKEIGRTKAQVLRSIKDYDIANMDCEKIGSDDIVGFAGELAADGSRTPATIANYLSHLGAVFAIAAPAWKYPLNPQAMADAFTVTGRLGLTGKSKQRDRRPSLDELDLIMSHFGDRTRRRRESSPMDRITAFAIFSTRRQEEITRIEWADFDEAHSRVLVRDMKHPGQKVGNHTWCDLPEPALAIVKAMPRVDDRIFPYSTDAIGAAFTRACLFLGINTEDMPHEKRLHFHDLRHDGISRLFETGFNIPHVAAVSGHRSWTSLKRYTHLRQAGDKYEGWKWLPIVTTPMSA